MLNCYTLFTLLTYVLTLATVFSCNRELCPMTLTLELTYIHCREEPASEMSRSDVILLKSYSLSGHTCRTDCFIWTTKSGRQLSYNYK